jgi:hypothetical protein
VKSGLASVVASAAVKRLVAVEALPSASNQHEFNGVKLLKDLFGDQRQKFPATFVYLGSDEQDVVRASGFVTWYDARENHPARSEYRLYFPTTAASERLNAGDLAFILKLVKPEVLIAFVADGSTSERQLAWLLNLPSPGRGVAVREEPFPEVLGLAGREILAELGIDPPLAPPAEESALEILLEEFGGGFPSTAAFSQFARNLTDEIPPAEDPDGAIVAWLEREEALFRQLERHLVLQRIRQGFGEDVDAFVSFSLSVQNRRKSRVGQALENHLQAIFEANGISFSRGQVTERQSRPDFVFPGIAEYRSPRFPAERLTMLGVKSTCKDRWRQVLAEADRIRVKHLFTLEPAISPAQTDEMRARDVVLVIPASLHETFKPEQRGQLMSLEEFIAEVRVRSVTG